MSTHALLRVISLLLKVGVLFSLVFLVALPALSAYSQLPRFAAPRLASLTLLVEPIEGLLIALIAFGLAKVIDRLLEIDTTFKQAGGDQAKPGESPREQ